MKFHGAASDLREEKIKAQDVQRAKIYDLWGMIAINYGLRVFGLRYEFYRLLTRDPGYSKMIMPALVRRNEIAAADDLTDTLETLP